ncbi:hypothetical protein G7K71_14180 [Desulfofundulus sp. TPOSR]|nr:hypothetical protein [Desulfofundulus sp. TPOSR]NHM28107.1 hypothetical protein [Desulfofundulus sp. TPOSR]
MAGNKPWSPFAVVCAVHTLFDRFGKEKLEITEKAFAGREIALSQRLPE